MNSEGKISRGVCPNLNPLKMSDFSSIHLRVSSGVVQGAGKQGGKGRVKSSTLSW